MENIDKASHRAKALEGHDLQIEVFAGVTLSLDITVIFMIPYFSPHFVY